MIELTVSPTNKRTSEGSVSAFDSMLCLFHEHCLLDRSPKSPIVFCHGLMGFDTVSIGPSIAPLQVAHWRGIKEVLEANGIDVLITRVPATSSPVDRAKVLEKSISEAYDGQSVHLIGHSMVYLPLPFLHFLSSHILFIRVVSIVDT